MLDEPLAVMIKRDIAEIGAVYPASAIHIADALERIASLATAVEAR